MPIIIDTNCIVNVFDPKCVKHAEFSPVRDWIFSGKGKMVYGGTKYNQELGKLTKYLRIIRYLRENNKVIVGDKDAIDQWQTHVEGLRVNDDFDDPHLVAISAMTKCSLICSEDTRSIKYVKDKKYYPSGCKIPLYYTSSCNTNLLTDTYVHHIFKPLGKLNNKIQIKLNSII